MRGKISIAVTIITVCTGFFAVSAYEHYQKLDKIQDDIHVSLYLRSYANEIENRGIDPKQNPKETTDYFRKWRLSITEKSRNGAKFTAIRTAASGLDRDDKEFAPAFAKF